MLANVCLYCMINDNTVVLLNSNVSAVKVFKRFNLLKYDFSLSELISMY